jgi:hypothetical protein
MTDFFSNMIYCEIQRPGVLIAQKIGHVSLVGCTNDWQNRCSGRNWMLCMSPLIARVHLVVDSTPLRFSKAHRFNIEVRLKWEMSQKKLDTFENIPV